ncbi:hypothetical protein BVG16_13670 [Paenibacillus selenitireducens]|uniref:Uncharacterized protein n=1 Tax=Paenibacillus selenitireducens TaxID=1324314 RepID=A0A1T2XCT1_9BACL|nr:hypothetical protein [Paenibacillus selenitireducens]OPA77496.1 hypothetical protein BVG16_13670 [Paenibacillus selenitireducens]
MNIWLKEFKAEKIRADSAECRESQLKQALESVIHQCSGSPAYTDGAYACYYANRTLLNVYGEVSRSNNGIGQVDKMLHDIRRIAKDADMDVIVTIIDQDLGYQMGYHRIDLPCVGQLPKFKGVTG